MMTLNLQPELQWYGLDQVLGWPNQRPDLNFMLHKTQSSNCRENGSV